MPRSTPSANEIAFQSLQEKFTKACIAEMAGVTRQAITKWATVPSARVAAVATASGLTPEQIRPEPYAND